MTTGKLRRCAYRRHWPGPQSVSTVTTVPCGAAPCRAAVSSAVVVSETENLRRLWRQRTWASAPISDVISVVSGSHVDGHETSRADGPTARTVGLSSVVGVCTHALARQVSAARRRAPTVWSMQQRCTLTVLARTHAVRRPTEREGDEGRERIMMTGWRMAVVACCCCCLWSPCWRHWQRGGVAEPSYSSLQIAAN